MATYIEAIETEDPEKASQAHGRDPRIQQGGSTRDVVCLPMDHRPKLE